MIVGFKAPQGLTCPGCVLNRHGSLTVRRHHGVTVACDYTGQALTEDPKGTTVGAGGALMVAVQATQVGEEQHCVQCGEVVKITRSVLTRIVQRARVVLSHRRGGPAGAGGVAHGVTAPEASAHGASRPAPRPVQA